MTKDKLRKVAASYNEELDELSGMREAEKEAENEKTKLLKIQEAFEEEKIEVIARNGRH